MTTEEECERLRSLGRAAGAFTAEKHASYGGAYSGGAELLRLLAPEGVRPELYVAAILSTRIFEKLKRFFTDPKAFGESPLVDVIGHALCLAMLYGAKPPEQKDDARAADFVEAAQGYLPLDHPAVRHLRAAIAAIGGHARGPEETDARLRSIGLSVEVALGLVRGALATRPEAQSLGSLRLDLRALADVLEGLRAELGLPDGPPAGPGGRQDASDLE